MKTYFVSIVSVTTLSLAVGILGTSAQASAPPTGREPRAQDRALAGAFDLAKSIGPKRVEASKTSAGAQVAWCYWYRDEYNRPCH
jgi:hypothetical protein